MSKKLDQRHPELDSGSTSSKGKQKKERDSDPATAGRDDDHFLLFGQLPLSLFAKRYPKLKLQILC